MLFEDFMDLDLGTFDGQQLTSLSLNWSVFWSFILHFVALREVVKERHRIQWRFGFGYFLWNFLG